MLQPDDSLDIATLTVQYHSGELRPQDVIAGVLERIARRGDDHVWIDLLHREELLARAQELERRGPTGLPLFGIPFAIKDNIDLAKHPTTAACPEFAYTPEHHAPVVQALLDAGAIAIGKTNLDQFATGLVGVRSPYGVCRNPFNPEFISGGSSAGSAVAVAAGLVSFSLGTDTAGSGRVPAAFNNIIGLKPTRGLLSNRGVIPACRTLDCVSIFSLTSADARLVLHVAKGFDPPDPFSRHAVESSQQSIASDFAHCRIGVPKMDQLEFFGNTEGKDLFLKIVGQLERLGGKRVEIDFRPFLETARLLYEGPWLAERYVAIRDFFDKHPEALHPVTRTIIGGGITPTAADAFTAYYRLKELCRDAAPVWDQIDILVTPTAGTIYTIAEVQAEPFRLNSNLGYYTNFMNLMDLCAIAVPAGFQQNGLPFGITVAAPAFQDDALCRLGDTLHRSVGVKMGATSHDLLPWPRHLDPLPYQNRTIRLVVCGAHMSGLPLNHQLIQQNARLVRVCRTAALYRLFALPGSPPSRPGLLRAQPGRSIEVEVWELPAEQFGSFVDSIPAPLGIGTIELEDGDQIRGFLCEPYATAQAQDISDLGSWRTYLAKKDQGR
jgi:allophanate hydrolase